jgi:hypothetical protein
VRVTIIGTHHHIMGRRAGVPPAGSGRLGRILRGAGRDARRLRPGRPLSQSTCDRFSTRFPDTYNGQALWYAALAARKNYYSLHLVAVYANAKEERWLRDVQEGREEAGHGEACIRFKKLNDLPLDVIAEAIGRTTPEEFIAFYKATHKR